MRRCKPLLSKALAELCGEHGAPLPVGTFIGDRYRVVKHIKTGKRDSGSGYFASLHLFVVYIPESAALMPFSCFSQRSWDLLLANTPTFAKTQSRVQNSFIKGYGV